MGAGARRGGGRVAERKAAEALALRGRDRGGREADSPSRKKRTGNRSFAQARGFPPKIVYDSAACGEISRVFHNRIIFIL
jgi:hypothetical protein